jgi:hypothetical protein
MTLDPKDMEDLDCATTAIQPNDHFQMHWNMSAHPKDMEDLDSATIAIHANDHW